MKAQPKKGDDKMANKTPRDSIIEEYEINPLTMMILPTTYGSKTYSTIIEVHKTFLCPFPPKSIIQKSCKYFGVSYEGRIAGTKQIIGNLNKVPLTIDSKHSIYFLPTTSPQNSNCIWISHHHVFSYEPISPKTTKVTFRNKLEYEVPISYSSFETQLLRTAMLRMKLTNRIEEIKKKTDYVNLKYHLNVAEKGHYDSY